MRRIWIAIGICALLGGLCAWSLFYSQCEGLPILDKLEEADALAQEGNIEQLKEITEEIGELWDRWSWNANTFIRHEDLEPVESAISSMEGALRSGTIAVSYTHLDVYKRQGFVIQIWLEIACLQYGFQGNSLQLCSDILKNIAGNHAFHIA